MQASDERAGRQDDACGARPVPRRPMLAAALALVAGHLAADAGWGWALAAAVWCVAGPLPRTLVGTSRCGSGPRAFSAAVLLLAWLAALAPAPLAGLPAPDELLPRALVWERPDPSPWPLGRPRLRLVDGEPPPPTPAPTVARPGELVLVLPATPPLAPARGPVPGPMEQSGQAGLTPFAIDALVRLAPPPRSALQRLVDTAGARGLFRTWRRSLVRAADRLDAGLPPGLLPALLFGERGGLERETTDRFTRTGTRHLLAISGLHVGVLASCLILPLARLLASLLGRRLLEPLVALVLLALFVPLAGASPPVVRAALVLGLALTGMRGGRRGLPVDGLNLWGTALFVEGLLAPARLDGLSLRLSYLATLGLLLGLAPLARALERRLRGGLGRLSGLGLEAWRPAWSRPRRAVLAGALVRALALGLSASVTAVLATLPLAWHHFGELAPVGILLTPLVLPLLAWLLTLAWPLAVAAALVEGTLAAAPVEALARALLEPAGQLLGLAVTAADRLPGTPVVLPPRPLGLVVLAAGATLLALRSSRARTAVASPRRTRATASWRATAGLAWAGALLPWSLAPTGLELVALDVGHGTAVLLRGPSGRPWVFDAGTRDRIGLYRQALAPTLAAWDGGAPRVVLSHADRDHWSGLAELAMRRPVAAWYGHLPVELADQVTAAATRLDLTAGRVELAREGGLTLALLRGGPHAGNEGSRSLVVENAAGRPLALLTGDAEQQGLAELLGAGLLSGPLELLLLPHHGSDSPHLADLLEATTPGLVWVSSGAAPQLEAELLRRGQATLQTRQEGALGLRLPPWGRIGVERETPTGGSPRMQVPAAGLPPGAGRSAAAAVPAPPPGAHVSHPATAPSPPRTMRPFQHLMLPALLLGLAAPLVGAQELLQEAPTAPPDVVRDRDAAKDSKRSSDSQESSDSQRSSDSSSDSQRSSDSSSSTDRDSSSSRDAERDAKDLERVLTLASGQQMRCRARLEGDAWMVRQGKEWFPMPAASVAGQQPVKDIIKEAKKRERKLKMALADDRADQAFWLCERGLYTEALEHLEVALRKDPDHGASLTLIRSGRLPMSLPPRPGATPGSEAFAAELDGYLAATARMQRASRELALDALEVPAEALAEAFAGDLSSRDRKRRELAAQGLQRLVVPTLAEAGATTEADASAGATTAADVEGGLSPRERAVQVLLERAVLDGSDDVRQASARALKDMDQPALTAPLVRALGSKSSAVRANAAEALGILAQPVAAPALVSALAATSASGGAYRPPASHIFVGRQIAYVQDFDVEGFTNAVAADPNINVLTEGSILDVRVLSIKQELARSHERAMLRGALRHMTGQDFRYDAGRWGEWLAGNPLTEG